jgi:predicted permease
MWAAFKDLSFATRVLVRNRSFTVAVLILLTLSIGTTSAIFSFVIGILLRPLPIRDPEQVVVLNETNLTKDQLRSSVSPRNLEDWEMESKTIARFGAWRDWHFRITTPEGPEAVSSAIASPGLFDVLGLQPVLGRPFVPVDNTPGQDNVIQISYRFWQTHFGGNSNVIGKSLSLDNKSFVVVGVLPVDMDGLSIGRFDVWAPVSVDPDQNLGRHVRNRQVYARLKNGVSISEAQSEMTAIADQLAEAYPKEDKGWGVTMRSLYVGEVGSVRPALLTFFGAVAFVLLIACANIANLQLARAAKRRKELAIRTALGASRFQLIRQLLVENVVLAILGGCCGLLLAYWAIDLFVALTPRGVPRLQQVRMDGKVLGFALLVT